MSHKYTSFASFINYDTSKKRNTAFGLATSDEMCIDFLLFYPVQKDPVTGHEINLCSFLQGDLQNYTLCFDGGRAREVTRDRVALFSFLVENPTMVDLIGARTNFSVPGATCEPVIDDMSSNVVTATAAPSQSMEPGMIMGEPSPSCGGSEVDPFVSPS